MAYVTTQGVPLPPYPPPPKKVDPPTTSQKKKEENGQGPEVKKEIKKEKKGPIFANPPSEDPILPRRTRLLTNLHKEKARKAWPTATILDEIF